MTYAAGGNNPSVLLHWTNRDGQKAFDTLSWCREAFSPGPQWTHYYNAIEALVDPHRRLPPQIPSHASLVKASNGAGNIATATVTVRDYLDFLATQPGHREMLIPRGPALSEGLRIVKPYYVTDKDAFLNV